MKKLLLSIALAVGGTFAVNAQCTPGANYADSLFGVWPDTIQNFPLATANVSYTTDLNFKVPTDAGDIDPTFAGATIVSFSVNDVVGLPPGMDYTCNISNCSYLGGANGCAQITGTCATPGTYDIQIDLTATVSIPFVGEIPVPQSFTGYKIIVGSLGVVTLDASNVTIFPNPVLNELTLEGLSAYNFETIEIFNAAGQSVKQVGSTELNKLELNVADLNAGVYMIHLNGMNGTTVKKFIKQ